MTNAAKFGRGRPVRVRVTQEPSHAHAAADPAAAGRPWLAVHVRDEGPGLTPEQAAACFTSKTAAPAAAGGGFGLGLYISHAFAQLMSGSLSVDSRLGEGSTFTLVVPVRVLAETEAAAVAAADAAAARAAAEEAAAEQAAEAAHQAAVALASQAAMGVAEAAASVDAHAGKRARAPPPPSRRRFRVLVADDHPLNLRLVTRLLQLHDFDVTPVADGGAALAALQASYSHAAAGAAIASGAATAADTATAVPFDVAVLDMNMPVLTGTQVAAAFRAWEAVNRPGAMKLPLIALTANVAEEHAVECSEAGMVRARAQRATAWLLHGFCRCV